MKHNEKYLMESNVNNRQWTHTSGHRINRNWWSFVETGLLEFLPTG